MKNVNLVLEPTENPVDNIRTQIRTLVDGGEVTYSTIAREISMSNAALSQFMKDVYKGDNERLFTQLNIWLENRAHRNSVLLPEAPDFIETKTATQIWSALQYAQFAQCITIIYGIPGVGKTKAIREFSDDRSNVWLITASPSCSSLSECLYELALEMGMTELPRRSGQIGRALRRRLCGTAGLIIIDEADHLEYPVLEELRILQEETSVGLTLVGNHQVYSKLTGGTRRVDFARLFSRIAKKVAILKTKNDDVTAICDAWELGVAERTLIQSIAERPGALRTVSHTLRLAAMFARGNNESLTEQHIRAAIRDLEGG